MPKVLAIFTARRYASAVYVVILCPSVRLPVRLLQVSVVLRRLNLGSRKQSHRIAKGLYLLTPTGLITPKGAPNISEVG